MSTFSWSRGCREDGPAEDKGATIQQSGSAPRHQLRVWEIFSDLVNAVLGSVSVLPRAPLLCCDRLFEHTPA
jgi:hypothetical protein